MIPASVPPTQPVPAGPTAKTAETNEMHFRQFWQRPQSLVLKKWSVREPSGNASGLFIQPCGVGQMNRYLDLLKKSEKRSGGELPKPPKPKDPTFGSFGSITRDRVSTNQCAANDWQVIPGDCVGALRSTDGALYLPWGPRLSLDDVRRTLAELVSAIEELAGIEYWPRTHLDDVVARAIRGPLSDLLPNRSHFGERLVAARAEAEAREVAARRAWRANADLSRRGYR